MFFGNFLIVPDEQLITIVRYVNLSTLVYHMLMFDHGLTNGIDRIKNNK